MKRWWNCLRGRHSGRLETEWPHCTMTRKCREQGCFHQFWTCCGRTQR